jgi:hypothetical protein
MISFSSFGCSLLRACHSIPAIEQRPTADFLGATLEGTVSPALQSAFLYSLEYN